MARRTCLSSWFRSEKPGKISVMGVQSDFWDFEIFDLGVRG